MAGWVYLLPDDAARIGTPKIVEFDATMSETHDSASEVTEHPVEEGSAITDHVRRQPFTFTCEVYITNTPSEELGRGSTKSYTLTLPQPPVQVNLSNAVGAVASAIKDKVLGPPPPLTIQVLTFDEKMDRVKETYETLLLLQSKAVTMAVVTSVKQYEKMVLVNIGLPRTELGGASFNLSFKQIRVVQTETVAAPQPVEPRGAPGQKKGGQSTKKPGDKDKGKATSLAVKALKSVGVIDP